LVSPGGHHEPEPLVLTRALDLAWDEVAFALARDDLDAVKLRTAMALAVLTGLRESEHDLERLKELALDAIAKVY
jgi:hypothetical protein